MNVKQVNRIFARAMYSMVIVAVVISVYATPVAADNKTPVGEKIRIRDDWMSYPVDTPFHIAHGWVQSSEDGAIGVFDFKLDVDGIPQEEDYKDFSTESGEPDILTRIWVFNFPDGMTGEHSFTGHWFAPCQYAVDWLDYPGPCKKPNEKVETYTATLTVSFNLPTFVAYMPVTIVGYDWPVGHTINLNIEGKYTAQAEVGNADWDPTVVLFELWRDDISMVAGDHIFMTDESTGVTKEIWVTNLAVTDFDLYAKTVSGIYDPMYNLWTWLYDLEGQVPETDPDTGTWVATFTELPPGAWGGATQWDEDGDGTSIDFQVPNTRFTVWPEWNYLEGYEWPDGASISISVFDKETCSIDATSAFPEWDPWNTFFSVNFPEDCDIGMGDFITLNYGLLSLTHQIQELTITDVNLEFDTVIGTAAFDPEQYMLHAWIHDVDGSYMQLSAEDGNWLADFGSQGFNLQPGMGGRVELVDQASNATAVDWHVPLPSFAAYMPGTIEGYDWPMGHTIALNINDGEYIGQAISEQRPDFPDGETRVLFELWRDEFSMETGDHILMTDETLNFTKELYVADLQVTEINLNNKTVFGIYDPDRSFWTQLEGQDPADIVFDGNTWLAIFADMVPGTWGYIAQDDDDHDGTVWDFQIPVTFNVSSTGDVIDNDGVCTLREAIIAANTNSPSGDMDGECPAGSDSQTDTILLSPDQTYLLAISGSGEEDSYSGDLDIWDNSATIDLIIAVEGSGMATVLQDTAVGDRVLQNHGASVRIEGLTLTGGNEGEHGGGSILNHGSLTLTNCNISGNATVQDGGGIANSGELVIDAGTVSANNAQFGGGLANWPGGTATIQNGSMVGGDPNEGEGNTAVDDGGGIFNYGVLNIDESTVSGNYARYGGGLANWGGEVNFVASIISYNSATNNGGGVLNKDEGTTTIQNGSTVSGNSSPNGGGVANWDGTVILTNSTVSGNSAGAGGGLDNWGTATVTDSQVTGNTVTWAGGGIHNNFGGTLTVYASTISYNSSDVYGGGIMNWDGSTVTLTNSTITGNTTPIKGGGIGNAGNLTVENTILSANTATQGGGVYSWGVALITDGTLVEGNIASDSSAGGGGGGGLFNIGTMTAESITVTNNKAPYGGGLFNWTGGMLTISNTVVLGNSADQGGGLTTHENSTTVIQNGSLISNNTANWAGGGVNNWGMLTITGSILYNNTSLIGVGNAINSDVNVENAMSVTESCIVGNGGVAVFNSQTVDELATGNWWGDASGPSGAGPGSGDSVSPFINFSGWLAEPPSICAP